MSSPFDLNSPDGVRTRVTGLKGQRPRPLDDGSTKDRAPRFELGSLMHVAGGGPTNNE